MRIRYHLDEHIASAIATGLRRREIEVTDPVTAGLLGAPDHEQLRFAASIGHVLVTQDRDFLRLHKASGVPHGGLVYFRQGSLTIGEAIRRLVLIHDALTAEEMANRVEFL